MSEPKADEETRLVRLPSGIDGLDVVLKGGFLRGGIYIIQGPPGAGKTILGNQICSEGSVRLFAEEAVAFLLVDAAGGGEDGVGPEDDAFVTGGSGEGSALVDEGVGEAKVRFTDLTHAYIDENKGTS